MGRWVGALARLERAQVLDPRNVTTERLLTHTLVRLRRYPEGIAAADRSLAVAPSDLDLLLNKAMLSLAQGDYADSARLGFAEALRATLGRVGEASARPSPGARGQREQGGDLSGPTVSMT